MGFEPGMKHFHISLHNKNSTGKEVVCKDKARNDNRKVNFTSTSCVKALQAFPLLAYPYQNSVIYKLI